VDEVTSNVGIGEPNPLATLHVDGNGVDPSLRVQVNNSTKLLVAANGGTTLGVNNNSPPSNGL